MPFPIIWLACLPNNHLDYQVSIEDLGFWSKSYDNGMTLFAVSIKSCVLLLKWCCFFKFAEQIGIYIEVKIQATILETILENVHIFFLPTPPLSLVQIHTLLNIWVLAFHIVDVPWHFTAAVSTKSNTPPRTKKAEICGTVEVD